MNTEQSWEDRKYIDRLTIGLIAWTFLVFTTHWPLILLLIAVRLANLLRGFQIKLFVLIYHPPPQIYT